MSKLVWEEEVSPLGALVSIRDMGTSDYPSAETGDESVVALPGHVYVSTQSDSDGYVCVQVRVGDVDIPGVRVIYDAALTVLSGVLSVTPPGEEDEETIVMPWAGEWRLKIAVSGSPYVNRVYLFFAEQEWLR